MSELTVEDAPRRKVRLSKTSPRIPMLQASKRKVIGPQTTWNELVAVYLPGVDEATADYLLWERTCFPMGSIGEVARQLRQVIVNGHIAVDLRHWERDMRELARE